MARISLVIDFELLPEKFEEFTAIMRDHARQAREIDPGCLRFDLMYPITPEGERIPNRLVVDELYESLAAFAEHQRAVRMPQVRAAISPLIANRRAVMSEVE